MRTIKSDKEPPSIDDYMQVLSSLIGVDYDPHGAHKTMIVPGPTAMMPDYKRSQVGTRQNRGLAVPPSRRDQFPFPNYVSSEDVTNPFVRMEEVAHSMQHEAPGGNMLDIKNAFTLLPAAQRAIRQAGKVMKEKGNFLSENIDNRRQFRKTMKKYFGYRNENAGAELEAKAAAIKAGMMTEGLIPEGYQFTEEDLPAVEEWIYNTLGPSYTNALMQARGTEKGAKALVKILNTF